MGSIGKHYGAGSILVCLGLVNIFDPHKEPGVFLPTYDLFFGLS